VITLRSTRLLRVPDLRAMHAAVADCACAGTPRDVRACAVVIPTRAAGEALRTTLERLVFATGVAVAALPDLVTRADLYVRLHRALDNAPPLLTEFEREVLFRRAARAAENGGLSAPFNVRPGLVSEILTFYDDLRRRGRSIDDFDRLTAGTLEPIADIDRGAERMLRQTRFLVAAFTQFASMVEASGRLDEHTLRARLFEAPSPPAYTHLVVTIADQAADAHGLWPADFDLLARVPGIERVDVIVTEAVLGSGFHERLHGALPGIEEVRRDSASAPPVLIAPASPSGSMDDVRWFVARDREEELADAARRVKTDPRGQAAIVYQRPLPYLYLATHVFGDADVAYQTTDALPLAGQPAAAALDLLFTFASVQGTRASIVELLSCPHWRFPAPGPEVDSEAVAAADVLLRERKFVGGWERLEALVADLRENARPGRGRANAFVALPALAAIETAGRELRAALGQPRASEQIEQLAAFVRKYERLPDDSDPWRATHLRARAAILSALVDLGDAHRRHDDEPLGVEELASTLRRWMERHTFAPRRGNSGVMLLDARAARYADVDDVLVVGLVETDWPERTPRNIFYPSSLLAQLGWHGERDRLAAARAVFRDLLTLARSRVAASTFSLEDDGLVAKSAFLEELDSAVLTVERVAAPAVRVFRQEAMSTDPVSDASAVGVAAEWLALRRRRTPATAAVYHGASGSREPVAYAVSHVERYLDCPFKYFSSYVLRLDEERDEEAGLTPQERGQFVHEVFEAFFSEWQAAGNGAITTGNIESALSLFRRIADARLETLPESDRALERTHLFGSAASPGLAERAFAFEIEQACEVVERLLEHKLEGEFDFAANGTSRRLRIRAKADRIDLLANGVLRVIDYKLSRAPKPSRALQLPVYGVCASQLLEGRHGRSWAIGSAGYVAFRERNPFVSLGATQAAFQQALVEGQQRMLDAVAGIERGAFPPDPDEPFLCTRCGYAGVCRKDYVGDE
jgi:PD-(D/E)XK nuclease superfamily protein